MSTKQSNEPPKDNVVELVNTSVLIPRNVQNRIRVLAAENQRTMGAEIRVALERHINAKPSAA